MTAATLLRADRMPVLWRALPGLTRYPDAIGAMHEYADEIIAGRNREAIWLLTCPAGYNPGIASQGVAPAGVPGVPVDVPPGPRRAGDWNYHGPGVRVIIVMLDLRRRRKDSAGFVAGMHDWLAGAVAVLGIAGARREAFDPAGLWVNGTDKVAAMGFRLTQWVTRYGAVLYVDPDLQNFAGIKPCGIDIPGKGVTSIAARLRPAATPTLDQVDAALREAFHPVFGPTSLVA